MKPGVRKTLNLILAKGKNINEYSNIYAQSHQKLKKANCIHLNIASVKTDYHQ